jgi:hypothetical protein
MSASGSQRLFKLSFSDYQGPLLINRFFRPDMLNPSPPIRTEVIETQAVRFLIDLINESLFQNCPLSRIYNTFEDGFLDPLTIVLTRLRHLT